MTVDDVSENLVWLDNSLGCGLSRAGLVSICWGLGGPWCNGDWSLEDWSRGDHGARSTEVWRSEVGHGRIDLLGQHGWTGVTEQGLGLDGSDSGDSGEVAGDEVDQDSVRMKRDEVRRCRGQSRGSSLRTPKHTQAKLSYTAAVESDSDQETRLSSPHKPRRHSFREPRAPGGHMETRSQRSSPKNSLQTSDTMLMVSGGDRSTMRRHSAVSVLSDSATIAMVRRPSVVTSDHTGGQYPGRSRRQSGQSRRSSDDRVSGRRRSSVERMHGDNNITIVVSQDDINSNNNITRGERFKQSVFLEDSFGNLISAFKSIFQ